MSMICRSRRVSAWGCGFLFIVPRPFCYVFSRSAIKLAHRTSVSTFFRVFTDLPKFTNGIRCERSEEHTSELQSRLHLVCRLLLEKKQTNCPQWRQRRCRARWRPGPGSAGGSRRHFIRRAVRCREMFRTNKPNQPASNFCSTPELV